MASYPGRLRAPWTESDDSTLDAAILVNGEIATDAAGRLRSGNGVAPGGLRPLDITMPVRRTVGPVQAPTIIETLGEDLHGDFLKLPAFVPCNQASDGPSSDAKLIELIQWAKDHPLPNGKPRRIYDPKLNNRYRVENDFVIDTANQWIEGSGDGTIFEQTNNARGLFRVFGEGATIKGLTFQYEGTRDRITGSSYYGLAGFQRTAGIMLHAGHATIEDIRIIGRSVGICLLGPVRRRPDYMGGGAAQEGDPESGLDYSNMAPGNILRCIYGENTDFLLTGMSQRDLLVDGLICRGITMVELRPPHHGYIEPKGSGIYRGRSKNVRFLHIEVSDNPYSQAFKGEGLDGFEISMRSQSCAGGLVLNDCTDGRVIMGDMTDIVMTNFGTDDPTDDGLPYGVLGTNVRDTTFEGGLLKGRAGHSFGGVFLRRGSVGCRVRDFAVVDHQSLALFVGTPFRVSGEGQGACEVSFENVSRRRVNADGTTATPTDTSFGDKAMFVAGTIGDVARISGAQQSGSAQFIDGVGTVSGWFNSALVGSGAPVIDGSNLTLSLTDTRAEERVLTTSAAVGTGYGIFNSGSPGTEATSYTTKYVWERREGRTVRMRVRIVLPTTHGLSGASGIQFRWPRYIVDTGASRVSSPRLATTANITVPAGAFAVIVPVANTRSAKLQSLKDGVYTDINVSQLSTASPPSIEFEMEFDTDDNWIV